MTADPLDASRKMNWLHRVAFVPVFLVALVMTPVAWAWALIFPRKAGMR